MNRRIILPLSAAVATVAVAAVYTLSSPHDGAHPSDTSPRFEVGRTDAYRVEWSTRATAALPIGDQPPFDVSSALAGTWAVTTVRRTADSVVQHATLRTIDSLVVLASGEPLDVDPATIEGVVVTLTRTNDGALTDIHFAPGTDGPARNTLTGMARLFSVQTRGGERAATYGTAIDAWSGDTRTVTSFTSLTGAPAGAGVSGTGHASASWGHGGRLLDFHSEDHARAEHNGVTRLDTSDTVTWTFTGTSDSPVRATPRTRTSLAPAGDPLLQQRAAEVSGPDLVATVSRYDGGDVSALMWSGTARLAVDADARRQVADIAIRDTTTHVTRELALDLLAHTPDGLAEGELLAALSHPTVAEHPERAAYIGRLSFVRRPSDASIDWLHTNVASPDPSTARAARLALGAVARRYPSPDHALTPLRVALPANADDAANLLGALGNAAQPDDVPALVAATSDPRPRVRAAAIHALRHAPDDDAIPVLQNTAHDGHPGVQRATISELTHRATDPTSTRILSEAAINGTLDPANHGLLTTLIASSAPSDDGNAALRAMMQDPTADATLRARMRAVLSR